MPLAPIRVRMALITDLESFRDHIADESVTRTDDVIIQRDDRGSVPPDFALDTSRRAA
jgi:hypothetical protein